MKKMIFFDFDGTIYDNKNKNIPLSTIEALKKLSQMEDVILGLATGRSIQSLQIAKDLLPLFKIKILINGAYVLIDDHEILKNSIKKNDLTNLLNFLNQEKIEYGMITKSKSLVSGYNELVEESFREFGIDLPQDYRRNTSDDVCQVWIFGSKSRKNEFQEKFKNLKFINWSFDGIDVIKKGVSKGKGIKEVCKIINCDEIYAFGDGLNDIEMFEIADYSIAMGQSSDYLKSFSTYVTDSVDKEGIVKGLNFYNLI